MSKEAIAFCVSVFTGAGAINQKKIFLIGL